MQHTHFIRNSKLRMMNYPVGNSIAENMPIIREMAMEINRHFGGGDNKVRLICRGSSGSIIAGIISSLIPIQEIVYVPKPGERRHSGSNPDIRTYNDDMTGPTKNVIVDDFISSGETIKIIYDTVKATVSNFKIHGLVVSAYVDVNRACLKHLEVETIIAEDGSDLETVKTF